MNNTELLKYIKENAKKGKNGNPYYYYCDMLIYNDLKLKGTIDSGLNSLIEIYDKLFSFGLSLSGYQFIGLIFEKSFFNNSSNPLYPFAYFMLAFGFIISLFGALLSFCMYEFLVFMRNEPDEYKVKGITTYKRYLKLPHIVLKINTFCFALPINIMIYTNLHIIYGIIFNVMSVILLSIGFPIHTTMVGASSKFDKALIDKDD